MKKSVTTAAILAILVGAAVAWYTRLTYQTEGFYQASHAELKGAPGSVIRSMPINIGIEGAEAWRVLYRSVGLTGEPVAISGIVVAPIGEAPAGGYPVVAWAHPTTGIARKCAPSLNDKVGQTIPGLTGMIKRGFAVAATDYAGLGAGGPHPYLVGISAARSVIDSVRAAGALLPTSGNFVVWGHSQGGHAAFWTGQLADDYAPDLSLLGVTAAAPATELSTLFEDDRTTGGGKVFSAMALLSWSRIYGADLNSVLKADARPGVLIIGEECLVNAPDIIIDTLAVNVSPSDFLKADPTTLDPWKTIIRENTPTSVPPGRPVLIAQGSADQVVRPTVTRDFARGLCAAGASVELVERDANHLSIATLGADLAVGWMADRLAGKPAPNGCSTLAKQ